jgi:hypothetical protein
MERKKGESNMYKLVWKTQSSNVAQHEMHDNIQDAVKEFRGAMEGLYAHGGGMVALLEEESFETGAQALVKWEEHISGGFGSGTAWYSAAPIENLDEDCQNEGCCWNDEESQEMCEDCEQKSINMVLEYLLQ